MWLWFSHSVPAALGDHDGSAGTVGAVNEPSRDTELWAAGRVRAMHQRGRCAQCPAEGECGMLTWAEMQLRTWERERGQTFPDQTPVVGGGST